MLLFHPFISQKKVDWMVRFTPLVIMLHLVTFLSGCADSESNSYEYDDRPPRALESKAIIFPVDEKNRNTSRKPSAVAPSSPSSLNLLQPMPSMSSPDLFAQQDTPALSTNRPEMKKKTVRF